MERARKRKINRLAVMSGQLGHPHRPWFRERKEKTYDPRLERRLDSAGFDFVPADPPEEGVFANVPLTLLTAAQPLLGILHQKLQTEKSNLDFASNGAPWPSAHRAHVGNCRRKSMPQMSGWESWREDSSPGWCVLMEKSKFISIVSLYQDLTCLQLGGSKVKVLWKTLENWVRKKRKMSILIKKSKIWLFQKFFKKKNFSWMWALNKVRMKRFHNFNFLKRCSISKCTLLCDF